MPGIIPVNWSDQYVGIPHKPGGGTMSGCDCGGLVRLVYSDLLRLYLPAYNEPVCSPDEIKECHEIVTMHKQTGNWQHVNSPYRVFDVLVFTRGGFDGHVALALGNSRLMLHVAAQESVKIADYSTGVWAPRFAGAYRHAKLM